MADQRWLVIMAREPRAGRVKTRLANDIGIAAATAFYRHTLAHVTARLATDPRWNTLIAVTPDVSLASPMWPAGAARVPQGQGDLGARMQHMFDCLPRGPVMIIGSDIPRITASHVAEAFRALGSNGAVIGPGNDGGYWLIGQRRCPRVHDLFSRVRWSSPHAMSDTLANMAGMRVKLLAPLGDVDDAKSHRRIGSAGGRLILPAVTG